MARQRNPRRITVGFLRAAKRDFNTLLYRWNVKGTVYLEPDEREHQSQYLRPGSRTSTPRTTPRRGASSRTTWRPSPAPPMRCASSR